MSELISFKRRIYNIWQIKTRSFSSIKRSRKVRLECFQSKHFVHFFVLNVTTRNQNRELTKSSRNWIPKKVLNVFSLNLKEYNSILNSVY